MIVERSTQIRPTVREYTTEDQRQEEIRSGLATGGLAFAILTVAGIIAYAGELSIAAVVAIPVFSLAAFSGFSFSEARRLKKKIKE